MILVGVLLTGCSVSINGSFGQKYDFNNYDEFLEVSESIDSSEYVIDRVETMSLEDVEGLTLGTVFEDIVLVYEDREDIEVRYFGVFSNKNNEDHFKLTIKTSGEAEFLAKWKNTKGFNTAMMVAHVPESFEKDLNVNTVSGDIEGKELYGEAIELGAVSGDITCEEVTANRLNAYAVSGDIFVRSFVGKELALNTTSGDILIDFIQSEQVEAAAVSGDVRLTIGEQMGDIRIDTVSGDVTLEVEKANADVAIQTTSGDISTGINLDTISVKKERELSGKISKGKYLLKIKTTSGDVNLR